MFILVCDSNSLWWNESNKPHKNNSKQKSNSTWICCALFSLPSFIFVHKICMSAVCTFESSTTLASAVSFEMWVPCWWKPHSIIKPARTQKVMKPFGEMKAREKQSSLTIRSIWLGCSTICLFSVVLAKIMMVAYSRQIYPQFNLICDWIKIRLRLKYCVLRIVLCSAFYGRYIFVRAFMCASEIGLPSFDCHST